MGVKIPFSSLCFSEPEEPDHDDQPVGGAVLAGLQAQVGPGGVRRGAPAPRAQRPHLAAGHRALQQVSRDPGVHFVTGFVDFLGK